MKYDRGFTTLNPWGRGMNNKASARALPEEVVRNAVNVDFRTDGDISCRQGYTKSYSGVGVHSGFTCAAGAYFVEGGVLKKFSADNNHTTILSGVTGPCNYCCADGELFVSDGTTAWRDGAVWGLPVPTEPVVSVTTDGGIGRGQIMVAFTFVTATGAESGAGTVAVVPSLGDSSLNFPQIPLPSDSRVTTVRVYASLPDGEVLYRCADLPAGSIDVTISAVQDSGMELATEGRAAPPAGGIIRKFSGRMYVAVDDLLWYTDPFALDLVDMRSNVVRFPGTIKIVEAVAGGLWVVADRTFFLAGAGPEDFVQREMLSYGALAGNAVVLPSKEVMWYSERGIIVAGNGELKNIQEKNVAADTGESCSVSLREIAGIPQAMVSIRDPQVSRLAASDFFDAEVIRRGA